MSKVEGEVVGGGGMGGGRGRRYGRWQGEEVWEVTGRKGMSSE